MLTGIFPRAVVERNGKCYYSLVLVLVVGGVFCPSSMGMQIALIYMFGEEWGVCYGLHNIVMTTQSSGPIKFGMICVSN